MTLKNEAYWDEGGRHGPIEIHDINQSRVLNKYKINYEKKKKRKKQSVPRLLSKTSRKASSPWSKTLSFDRTEEHTNKLATILSTQRYEKIHKFCLK